MSDFQGSGTRSFAASGFLAALVAASVFTSGGCSSSKLQKSSVAVFAGNTSVGYTVGHFAFDVFVVDSEVGCTIAQTAKVLIDGVQFPFMYDCTVRDVSFTKDRGFTIRVEDEGDTAEVVVNGLVPGLSTTLLSPTDGRALAGDALTVSVPPTLQALSVTYADFAYLDPDDPTFAGQAQPLTAAPAGPTVQATAPVHPGHFTFWMVMRGPDPLRLPDVPATVTSCTGFARCNANGAAMLGPLPLEVLP